jgi:hypothetical protein
MRMDENHLKEILEGDALRKARALAKTRHRRRKSKLSQPIEQTKRDPTEIDLPTVTDTDIRGEVQKIKDDLVGIFGQVLKTKPQLKQAIIDAQDMLFRIVSNVLQTPVGESMNRPLEGHEIGTNILLGIAKNIERLLNVFVRAQQAGHISYAELRDYKLKIRELKNHLNKHVKAEYTARPTRSDTEQTQFQTQ